MPSMNQSMMQVSQFWATRTANQRLLLGGGTAAVVALLVVLTQLMMKPDMKPLMSGLESADAQAITSQLTAQKIPYELSPDGKSINVSADQLDAARLLVASSSSTHSGRMGFEIFDKVSWGQTEFDEKVNYQRALEGELERTIVTLGGVKSARVHLVLATDSVFIDRERAAKASVTLKTVHGELSREQIQSLQRLVSGAVDGLKPADVSIIDADSNESMGGAGNAGGSEDAMERQMNERLVATLGPVIGPDHLRSSVNVDYDSGTTEISEDKYDPAVTVPLTLQKSSEQSGPGSGVGGVAGTSSNIPRPTTETPNANGTTNNTTTNSATNSKANLTAPMGDDATQTSTTENATYGVNRVSKHSVQPAGRIRRLTAALVIDDNVKRTLQPNGKWTETRSKRRPEELKQIEILASNAIGIDPSRGDVITIQNLAFNRADAADVPPVTAIERARKGLSDYSSLVRYGMLFLLFGLAYMLMIRPMQQKVFAGNVGFAGIPALPEGSMATMALDHPMGDAQRALQLKGMLIEQVKADPADSARLVQAWMKGATD